MTLTSYVVKSFFDHYATGNIMTGGGSTPSRISPSLAGVAKPNFFVIIFSLIIIILIKAFIVYLGYNYLMPKLIYSLSQDKNKNQEVIENNFKQITYVEAIVFSIFSSVLFSN